MYLPVTVISLKSDLLAQSNSVYPLNHVNPTLNDSYPEKNSSILYREEIISLRLTADLVFTCK